MVAGAIASAVAMTTSTSECEAELNLPIRAIDGKIRPIWLSMLIVLA